MIRYEPLEKERKIGAKKIQVKPGILSVLALTLVAIMIALPACKSAPAPASTPTGQMFQTLADAGHTVYTDKCAVCHGNNGQPSNKFTVLLWGTGATLGNYHGIPLFSDAQEMLTYMSKTMPLNASGNLTELQYVNVLAYILVQADMVSPSTVFDERTLSSIPVP